MKNLTLMLLLSIPIFLFSQNYQAVTSNRKALFTDINDVVHTLKMDSVKLDGTDSIFYPFTQIRDVNGYLDCFNPFMPHWIGQKIRTQTNGNHYFYNKNGDSLLIKSTAPINATWQVMTGYTAEVTQLVWENVLGVMDSVKTISISDGNQFTTSIKLGRSYGFVNTGNFYLFPNLDDNTYYYDTFQTYELAGLSTPEIGLQNLTWFDVFDFQVGDIIHNEQTLGNYDITTVTQTAKTYLSRSDYNDSIVYQAKRERLIEEFSPNPNPIQHIIDTIFETITLFPDFDLFPEELTSDINWKHQFSEMNTNPFITKKIGDYLFPVLQAPTSPNVTCWGMIAIDGSCMQGDEYYKGLGGPYNICDPYMYPVYTRNILVYYDKGGIEWGTPIDFTVEIESHIQNFIEVYPNPADNYLVVNTIHESYLQNETIEIYDLTGKLVMSSTVETSKGFTIDVSVLQKGIYLVKIGAETQKLVVE
ncbi:MAG: T9SS type A sorting domain-containing protein [Bacteroidales bacterium]|nr:T9SS type A sorting domain-containing protein [Bacteroidales bacterium]